MYYSASRRGDRVGYIVPRSEVHVNDVGGMVGEWYWGGRSLPNIVGRCGGLYGLSEPDHHLCHFLSGRRHALCGGLRIEIVSLKWMGDYAYRACLFLCRVSSSLTNGVLLCFHTSSPFGASLVLSLLVLNNIDMSQRP